MLIRRVLSALSRSNTLIVRQSSGDLIRRHHHVLDTASSGRSPKMVFAAIVHAGCDDRRCMHVTVAVRIKFL